jgi:hypothetical protein
MSNVRCWLALGLLAGFAVPAMAQSFRVQCPSSTITHPAASNDAEPAYVGPTTLTAGAQGYLVPSTNVNGAIKCQQISGGDGYATMGDGTQTYLFSFGPLSGLGKIGTGQPGTDSPSEFNTVYDPTAAGNTPFQPGDPATTIGVVAQGSFMPPLTQSQLTSLGGFYNGAVGLAKDIAAIVSIYDLSESGHTVTVITNSPLGVNAGDSVTIAGAPGYNGTFTVTATQITNPFFPASFAFQYTSTATNLGEITESTTATASTPPRIDGHVDARQIMDVGVMNGNIPAPLMAIDEDDEFFLTLTNVGMIMRPDLFEQHTVHFHGYPNASAFYDGVPDASVAINIGASFTYYYLAPDAGTYFWHCHITPPEHLQMGMVGQLFVRPRQNRVPVGQSLYTARVQQDADLRTACVSANDILCSNPLPPGDATTNPATRAGTGSTPTGNYAYNDGDGSTYYDVEYPIQIHGFDPNFHFVGMTFNPEGFADMKDKYFLLNGRSYPDTVTNGPLQTQ